MSIGMDRPAYTCDGQPVEAEQFYEVACNPERSVAIEACAGAGKTWILVSRILRALLSGAKPESILAITFTKKAAGEMRERLYEWLRAFSQEESDEKLCAELISRGVPAQEASALLPRLRALHWQLLSLSKGVEIRTFHGWFAQLLSAAPMGVLRHLGLPVRYDLIEDDSELFLPTWYALLGRCTEDAVLKHELDGLLQDIGVFNTQEALRLAWSRRVEFELADQADVVAHSVTPAEDPTPLLMRQDFEARWWGYAKALGAEKGKTPQKAALAIEGALGEAEPLKRLMGLREAIFIKDDDRLSNHLQKFEAAQQAEIDLLQVLEQHKQHQAYLYQQRMTALTRAFLSCYSKEKHEQKLVDMADLERAALHLLGDTETYGWIAEQLDTRITQVLIDEFQDTNPLQWQALKGWLSAYGGAGGGSRMQVFIVGDPKQSIYRFRRADPAVFTAACQFLKKTLGGSLLACDHTRRNAPQVIQAVNAVFEQAKACQEYAGFRAHTTASDTEGGVGRLPPILREGRKQNDPTELVQWRDSLTEPRYLEEEALRMQEVRQAADLIERWIVQDGWLPSDIKVLARRKDRLRELLVELNHRRIPWRFADDVHLIETLEVQDLICLLEVLTSPIHDLSVAQVLRSPLFSVSDDDLMLLAQNRAQLQAQASIGQEDATSDALLGNWWHTLIYALQESVVKNDSALQWSKALVNAAQMLQKWKAEAEKLPPHDLLDMIYAEGQVIEKYMQTVPVAMRESVRTNLQSLLQQALTLEGGRFSTPYHLMRLLKTKGIKNEHPEASDTLELLTIHGAKGLEARGIIILDTDPTTTRTENYSVLIDWPAEKGAPERFVFYMDQKRLSQDIKLLMEQEAKAGAVEELNALYVGMTRARERLVFSALLSSVSGAKAGGWWQRIDAVAQQAGVLELQTADDEETSSPKKGAVKPTSTDLVQLINTGPVASSKALEAFALQQLPAYENRHFKVEQLVDDEADVYEVLRAETGEVGVGRATSISQDEAEQAQRFGIALHRLLELEVLHDEALLEKVAEEIGLSGQQMLEAQAKAKQIMAHSAASVFFAADDIEDVEKEVELAYQGTLLRIDRLVKKAGQWWVLDFKSASDPLKKHQEDYAAQLSRYREALQAIWPEEVIHAALITGEGELLHL